MIADETRLFGRFLSLFNFEQSCVGVPCLQCLLFMLVYSLNMPLALLDCPVSHQLGEHNAQHKCASRRTA